MSTTFEVIVGSAVWLDAEMWTVQEITGSSILISNGKTLRRVGAAVVAQAHISPAMDGELSANESISLALSRLNPEKLKQLHSLERELLAILDREHEDGITQSELVRQVAERQGRLIVCDGEGPDSQTEYRRIMGDYKTPIPGYLKDQDKDAVQAGSL